ncbi:MAG: hypothetical protein GY711_17350 [bacterium]|nr:hypothetical protein [bacterium]
MKLLRSQSPRGTRQRRGAALLLSFLVLIVIIAITHQITRVTNLDETVADKELLRTKMDLTIESALLQVAQQLADDAEAAGGGLDPGAGAGEGDGGGLGGPDGEGGEGGEMGGEAVDSKMDEWATPESTTINGIEIRVLIQDEDSKYNVLNMLSEDEDEAQDAYDRVVRILDNCREGTEEDINGSEADEMARMMREHMLERNNSVLPRPVLLTDDDENENLGFPMSMEEFVVLEPFFDRHFRDYFDVDGERVHSVTSFLTIWTAPSVGGDAPEAGNGYSVNINTAPLAVLAALIDSRDVSTRFWDEIVVYRNEEEEDDPSSDEDDQEPILDEFGEPILQRQFFDDMDELEEVYEFGTMEPDVKDKVEMLLKTTSNVFSIYVTARVSTATGSMGQIVEFETRREKEEYERSGKHVVRTVRQVVWRRASDEETEIIPLSRWEVIDYSPMEVLDFRDEY